MTPVTKIVDTTLGELVTVLSDAAYEVCDREEEASLLVSLAIADISRNDELRRAVCAIISANRKELPGEHPAHA